MRKSNAQAEMQNDTFEQNSQQQSTSFDYDKKTDRQQVCQKCKSQDLIIAQLSKLKKAVQMKNDRIQQLEMFIHKLSKMALTSVDTESNTFPLLSQRDQFLDNASELVYLPNEKSPSFNKPAFNSSSANSQAQRKAISSVASFTEQSQDRMSSVKKIGRFTRPQQREPPNSYVESQNYYINDSRKQTQQNFPRSDELIQHEQRATADNKKIQAVPSNQTKPGESRMNFRNFNLRNKFMQIMKIDDQKSNTTESQLQSEGAIGEIHICESDMSSAAMPKN